MWQINSRNAAWRLRILAILIALPILLIAQVKPTEPMLVGPDETFLKELETHGVDKIARFTATEHSTILFSIADELTGYAKDGHIGWIRSHNSECRHPHPALSHDGQRVAFQSDSDTKEHCRIVIYDLSTGLRQDLTETEGESSEMSWSWDDQRIAIFENGVTSIFINDAAKDVFPVQMQNLSRGEYLTYGGWGSIQWLHDGKAFVVGLERAYPTSQPGMYTPQFELFLVRKQNPHSLVSGSDPAVSPLTDLIAYYSREGLVTIHADGTGRSILSRSHGPFFLPRAFPDRGIVWSSDASRLFCGSISENLENTLFLVDAKSGTVKRFLSHTSITIRGWH